MRFDFMVCSERSGSNLFTRIMNGHPDVCGPAFKHIMEMTLENLYRYGDLTHDLNWNTYCEDIANLLAKGHGKWKNSFTSDEIKDAVKNRSVFEVFRYLYEKEAKTNNKKRLFIKNNHLYAYAAPILTYFKDAKFVFLVRDPRDHALVWEESRLLPEGLVNAVTTWKKDQSKSIELYAQLKDLGRAKIIKFEDLLEKSEEVLSEVCSFLDMEYSDKMLEFYKDDTVIENAKRIGAWEDVAKPLMKSNHALYKKGLSENAIKYVEVICGEEMDFLGYKKDYKKIDDFDAINEEMKRRAVPDFVRTKEEKIFREMFSAFRVIENRKLF